MAVLVTNTHGHLQNQLTRSLERILEEANQSGELKLSNRKLKDFPNASDRYNLSDTVIADLSKNRFSELPDEVTRFHFLEKLYCYHNALRYIPDAINNLQCLSFLDLSRNQLTTLPKELCQLPIQILLVSNNNLTSLPDELHRMSELTELDASCNQLSHFPPRMGDLRSLQSLVLRSNLLLAIPVELTYLSLVRLDLRANRISMLPLEIRDMGSLEELSVEDNPLTSPPASLCRRGRVHIFKYLENEAIKIDRKNGLTGSGTLGRKNRRNNKGSSPGPPQLTDRLKKRQNVDSGYSTSSDGYDKRWSQELPGDTVDKQWSSSPLPSRAMELNGSGSLLSTPSTISPAPETLSIEEISKSTYSLDSDKRDDHRNGRESSSTRVSPFAECLMNGNRSDEKICKPLHQIQTYREYKEALKQQRAQDVPSVYRVKDSEDQSYKTEPNTPTHHPSATHSSLASSKSDPTPLHSVFATSTKNIFDDTISIKPVQRVPPSRTVNAHPSLNGNIENNQNGTTATTLNQNGLQGYIKPGSPVKNSSGILSHDNVPPPSCYGNEQINPKISHSYSNGTNNKGVNGVKSTKSISWNCDTTNDKLSFTMRREIDKAREETDLINQLRTIIENRLKVPLPEDLAPALTDGVVLCHLANHIKPRSVASIHIPSPAVPKLTMARCRRNVDNFIEACRKIGVDENLLCCSADVLEGKGLVQVAITVTELIRFHAPRSPMHTTSLSTVV